MKPIRVMLASAGALTALAGAVPASHAQAPVNDNYLQPIFINDEGNPFPRPPSVPGYQSDTTNATLQDDLFNPNGNGQPGSGGGPEPNVCGRSVYGKTIWTVFYADRFGRLDVSSSGSFDSVIAVIPFRSPNDPAPLLNAGVCVDRLAGFSEDFGSEPPVVVRGLWYAVQVGGFQDPATGAIGGGPVEVKMEMLRPRTVSGDAILRGGPAPGGIRLRELEVNRVARGARVQVRCRRARCTVTRNAATGSATIFARPTIESGRTARSSGRKRSVGPVAHAARTFRLLRGRRLPAGATIEVRITEPGKVGKYFRWRVRRGGVSRKQQRCLEPFSSRPRRRCG